MYHMLVIPALKTGEVQAQGLPVPGQLEIHSETLSQVPNK
jgi:hypothetical protein